MSDCIFCSIIKGEIPSYKIHEDDYVFAFMDINPINPGHVLVIPKIHTEHFQDIENEIYLNAMKAVKKIAKTLEGIYKPQKVGLMVAGFDVPHAHFHVVPMHEYHDLTSKCYVDKTVKQAPFEELEKQANMIKEQLS